MNRIPNSLTLSRAALALGVLAAALVYNWKVAAILSFLAIVTDVFDGYLAVKLNAKSKFGTVADPICDFLLTVCQVAGVFLTGIISTQFLMMLGFLFLATWLPVVLTRKPSFANQFALAVNRTYYVLVIVGFTALYTWMAVGSKITVLLACLSIPFFIWSVRQSTSHH